MSKLILIDGNAIIHRAFHALPPLSKKDGQLTNAVYGFFSMFLKIMDDLRPDCAIVCFDRPKPTFRQELYKEYQAHRPKMDDGLVPQFAIVHEILEKAKVKIFELDGYEADDIIGTLAFQAVNFRKTRNTQRNSESENQGIGKSDKSEASEALTIRHSELSEFSEIEVIIVSGDRDLLQLVNSQVKMLAPVTGITNMLLFDEKKVEEKYSLKTKQIIDYKALVGDASDGYPGVSGIGPKTAVGLLKEYQTLEGIYQNLDKINQKNEGLSQKLKNGEESAELAKKLATIILDTPITLDLSICSVSSLDKQALIKEFEKYGFKSLISRLEEKKEVQSQEQKKAEKKKEGEQLGLL